MSMAVIFIPLFILAAFARGLAEVPRRYRPQAAMWGLAAFVGWFCFLAAPVLTLVVVVVGAVGFAFFLRHKNRQRNEGVDERIWVRGEGTGERRRARREPLSGRSSQSQRDDSSRASRAPVPLRVTIGDIASLEWRSFEELCLIWLRAHGCTAERTPKRHGSGADEGIDIAGITSAGLPFCAQCKAHSGHVGIKFVREFFGAIASSKQRGVFFSSSGFTDDARRFAAKEGIVLVANSDLIDSINEPKTLALVRSAVFNGGETTPECPHCGRKMALRAGRTQFWGCVNYPRCRQKLHVRTGSAFPAERCRIPGDWLEAPAAVKTAPVAPCRRPTDDSRFAPSDDVLARKPMPEKEVPAVSTTTETPPAVWKAAPTMLFYLKDGRPFPVSKEQLSSLLRSKQLAGHTYICFGGDSQWRKAFSMPGLFSGRRDTRG